MKPLGVVQLLNGNVTARSNQAREAEPSVRLTCKGPDLPIGECSEKGSEGDWSLDGSLDTGILNESDLDVLVSQVPARQLVRPVGLRLNDLRGHKRRSSLRILAERRRLARQQRLRRHPGA